MGKTRIESKREAKKTRKVFDKVQKCDADSVDSIEVDVERIDVRFHHWTSQIITVKFCGEADIASGDVEFDAYILRNRLYVETKVKGIVETSNLKLDIWLPGNIFDEIRVNGNSAQVEINSGVVARLVRVETLSGNIAIPTLPNASPIQGGDSRLSRRHSGVFKPPTNPIPDSSKILRKSSPNPIFFNR